MLNLFIIFFKIGLFSIGGGYAIIPLIQEQVVNNYHWISANTFTDIITISQMTPGPLAVNTSTFVGIQLVELVVLSLLQLVVFLLEQQFQLSFIFFLLNIKTRNNYKYSKYFKSYISWFDHVCRCNNFNSNFCWK